MRFVNTSTAIAAITLSLILVTLLQVLGFMPLWVMKAICIAICAGAGVAGYMLREKETQ